MSFLLEKSNQNNAAFAHLKGLKLYAAAIHCGYYSCIQKMIHVLICYYPEEYEAGMNQIKGGFGNRHKFYIEEFSGRLSKDRRERTKMKNLLLELRTARIEADYRDLEVTDTKIDLVQSYIDEIWRLISKNLHL